MSKHITLSDDCSNNRANDFNNAFNQLMLNEGGYSNNKLDPGGETLYGITKRDYPEWFQQIYNYYKLGYHSKAQSVAKEFYKKTYWNNLYEEIPDSSLSFKIFDLSVNLGTSTAIRILQKTIVSDFKKTIKIDGKFGHITLGAIKSICLQENSCSSLYNLFVARAEKYYRLLKRFPIFGKGWIKRLLLKRFI